MGYRKPGQLALLHGGGCLLDAGEVAGHIDLRPGGLLIIDPLTVVKEIPRSDIRVVKVPTAEIALQVGNKKFQNMVALGVLYQLTRVISQESLEKAMEETVPPKTLSQNIEAFKKGIEYVRE